MALQDVLTEILGERTQTWVAAEIGRDSSQVSRWLSGKWRPEPAALQAFLDACAATPEQIVRAWEAFGTPGEVLATPDEVAARRRAQADLGP